MFSLRSQQSRAQLEEAIRIEEEKKMDEEIVSSTQKKEKKLAEI